MENKYLERYQPMLEKIPDSAEKIFVMTRVFYQMNFYSKCQARFRRQYQRFSLLSIIFNGAIPVLMLLSEFEFLSFWVRLATTGLSAAAGILTAVAGMKKYRELWLEYRLTLERLHLLVDKYFLRVGDLGSEDDAVRRAALQSQFEAIISSDHSKWMELLNDEKSAS